MLDVVVTVYKDGVAVNKLGNSKAGGASAILGSAVLGKMELSKG